MRTLEPARAALIALACLAAALLGACSAVRTGGTAGAPDVSPGAPTSGATPSSIAGAPERPTGRTERATLLRVVDGDTIRVRIAAAGGSPARDERVRYIGIDTPELFPDSPATPEPGARDAADANAQLVGATGSTVILERDVSERDQYGRLLRNAWVEAGGRWTLVNLVLVAAGRARVTTYPPDVKYVEPLLAAQRRARDAGLGVWGEAQP